MKSFVGSLFKLDHFQLYVLLYDCKLKIYLECGENKAFNLRLFSFQFHALGNNNLILSNIMLFIKQQLINQENKRQIN